MTLLLLAVIWYGRCHDSQPETADVVATVAVAVLSG